MLEAGSSIGILSMSVLFSRLYCSLIAVAFAAVLVLPDIALAGDALVMARGSTNCVDVEIGGERAADFDCLNRRLKESADRVQAIRNQPPLDAASPAERTGGFNETAVQQQFGPSFGRSVVPFRPKAGR